MRVYGRRKALALAVGLLAGAVACSGTPQPPSSQVAATARAPIPVTPSPSPLAVTLVEAAKVFATFTATDDLLRAGGAQRLAMGQYRDAEARVTSAEFQSTKNKPPRHTWGPPTLFVPRFAPDEKAPWFSVLVTRDGLQTLLTFAKGDDWRLSSATRLLPGEEPPQIELDAEGYATALPPDDKSVTISPQFMGPLHATIAEAGAGGVAAKLVAPGPFTTEVATQIMADREKAKNDGFSYDSIFSAGDFPVYTLRTTGGGALIQYAMSRTTTTVNKTSKEYMPVPDAARWAISSEVLRRTLKVTETHQYATAVPPGRSPAAARVIAHDGVLTGAGGE
ncbi:hypothetical protein ABT294_04330 [Nonomuraea sp. NPDC000554]|uniref:hypothetical protein n=1 Tax=Nonomuraea sp. NPDC000554 TaxID=3154259 RepID=UPI00332767C6